MKKLVSLVLALVMILLVGAAFAAGNSITINRDATWDENADSASVTFTYYKIFDAIITTAAGVNAETGELTGDDGVVVYTVDSEAKANALPSFFTANLASDGLYYVTLNTAKSGAEIAAALKTMVEANTTLFPGESVTSNANPVVIDGLDEAYYLILASNGKELAVQTIGEVEINEKNDYPSIDKKQKKAADPTYSEAVVPEEIGSTVNYQVTVHISGDATKAIKVFDTMTSGLTYNEDLAVSPDIAYTVIPNNDEDYNENATWQIMFSDETVIANRGRDVVITYTATVNANAITDSGKENEVTLIYDNGNYVLTDDTDYEIYFGGIYKVDPNDASADMSGVKFDLKDGNGAAVNVTYDAENGYYVVDPASTSNEVETRAEVVGTGDEAVTYYTIKIRGLDNDKTYTLTETETVAGYNLLNGTVTLTLTKDEGQAFSNKALNTFNRVENNKGTQLPSTGGIGTTIFYILGGLLVVGAAVLLIVRRKAKED